MKVFVAGPRAIRALNKSITDVLADMIVRRSAILVGDADGVDRLVQEYLAEAQYLNVLVYASGGEPRNNLGRWQVRKVDVPANAKGFDFYAKKDTQMARNADNGFMVWNGKSRGTLNNMINLVSQNKEVMVYLVQTEEELRLRRLDGINRLVERMGPEVVSLYHDLCSRNTRPKTDTNQAQPSLFEMTS